MKKLFTLVFLCLGMSWLHQASAQYQLVVAADGSGHYTTINEAMSAAVAALEGGFEGRVRIFVKNGVYNEPARLGSHNTGYTYPVSLVGESRDGVIIQCGNYKGLMDNTYPDKKEEYDYYYGNNQSATLTINSEDFYGENFTVINTKDSTVYAAGIYVAGRRQAYKNVSVKANRGAIIIRNGRPAFFMDSYVEGRQEMTASNGTVVFFNTTLHNKGVASQYAYPEDNVYFDVAAPGDTLRYGHIFRQCTFTAPDTTPDGSLFLAQPTAKESGAMFLDCKLSPKINPLGVKASANNLANISSWFYEYKNTMLDGTTPADVSGRAANVRQLSDTYLASYVYNNHIYGKFYKVENPTPLYYWDPLLLVAPAGIPQVTLDGTTLNWTAVPGAVGYVVYKDGAFAGMTEETTFAGSAGGTYTVCSVSESGAMSKPSGTASQQTYTDLIALLNKNISNNLQQPTAGTLSWAINDGVVTFTQPCDCQVYNLSGRLVMQTSATSAVSLQALSKGMYLLKTKNTIHGDGFIKVVR